VIAAIEELLKHDVAGDPITGAKWTRRTTEKISDELHALDIKVGPRSVARILKGLRYSLRLNHKGVCRTSAPDRNQQFEYIGEARTNFSERGLPVVTSIRRRGNWSATSRIRAGPGKTLPSSSRTTTFAPRPKALPFPTASMTSGPIAAPSM
jgi:DDE family transposase